MFKILAYTFTTILAITSFTWADDTLSFLDNGAGARARGMGNAVCAGVSDATAVYWNPALLSGLKKSSIQIFYNQNIYDYYNGNLFMSTTTKYGAFGFGLVYAGVLEIWQVNSLDSINRPEVSATLQDSAIAIMTAYGKTINPQWNIGLTAKGIFRTLAEATASGYALDIGTTYQWNKDLRLALSVRNLFSTGMQWQGTASNPNDSIERELYCGGNYTWRNLLISLQTGYRPSGELWHHTALGLEYTLNPYLALNCGIEQTYAGQPNQYSLGTALNVEGFYNFDYALVLQGDSHLPDRVVHYFTIGASI